MQKIRSAFPGCECYEIQMFAYLWKSEGFSVNYDSFYQVSTNVYNDKNRTDYWKDFKENYWVYTGGPGSGEEWPEHDSDYDGTYRLRDPARGDIVLVRYGIQRGHGIGIVYKNDYGKELSDRSRLHVL